MCRFQTVNLKKSKNNIRMMRVLPSNQILLSWLFHFRFRVLDCAPVCVVLIMVIFGVRGMSRNNGKREGGALNWFKELLGGAIPPFCPIVSNFPVPVYPYPVLALSSSPRRGRLSFLELGTCILCLKESLFVHLLCLSIPSVRPLPIYRPSTKPGILGCVFFFVPSTRTPPAL